MLTIDKTAQEVFLIWVLKQKIPEDNQAMVMMTMIWINQHQCGNRIIIETEMTMDIRRVVILNTNTYTIIQVVKIGIFIRVNMEIQEEISKKFTGEV